MAGYWVIDGKKMSNEEYMEMIGRQEAAREQARQQASALLKRLTDSYTELTEFMQENPGIVQRVNGDEEQMQQAIYQKLRQNLTQANAAPRCAWIKNDGTGCGSPKMRQSDFCYVHMQMWETRPKKKRGWTALEDANAIQMAIMEVQRALMDDEITEKRAGIMLYSLQIASANLAKTTFGEKPQEMVTDCVDAEENQLTAEARRRGENQDIPEQSQFTAKGAEDAKGNRGLSQMNGTPREVNADDTGLEMGLERILPRTVIAASADVAALGASAG
jgi:hypothetical protein